MVRARTVFLAMILIFLLAACQPVTAVISPTLSAVPTRVPETPTAALTFTPTRPESTATQALPTATFTSQPEQAAFRIQYHPDGKLYVGDLISMEVIAPEGFRADGKSLQIEAPTVEGEQTIDPLEFERYGLGERLQVTSWWSWDTAGLAPGEYNLFFYLLPDGDSWQETITLLPASELPNPGARWEQAESDCCEFHYISGTAAERDLEYIMRLADEYAAAASEKLEGDIDELIPVVLMPRVLGHGGFASQEIAVAYLDRNYAGGLGSMVLHHEFVHWIDSQMESGFRPSILVEGLAVYLSGGHFKPEPLMMRAAALLPPEEACRQSFEAAAETGLVLCGLDRYIPIKDLANRFYPSQHETGYLEAGALIEFMVETWGWQAFNAFYRDIPAPSKPGQGALKEDAEVIDQAVLKHFGIGLNELEARFIQALSLIELTPQNIQDIRLSIEYYETVRSYQQALDPSAFFLTAWLASSTQMRERGIVGDFLRHPDQPQNLAIELMLLSADEALQAQDFEQVERLLAAIQAVLDRIDLPAEQAFRDNRLAWDYYSLVLAVKSAGYEAQRIQIVGNDAQAWVSKTGPGLDRLSFISAPGGWVVQNATD